MILFTESQTKFHVYLSHFPSEVKEVALQYLREDAGLEEVRLRLDMPASLTVGGGNVPLSYIADAQAMEKTLCAFSDGSLYAYEETLKEGYLPLSDGCRLGIAGVAEGKGGRGIRHATALVLRLPRFVKGCARQLVSTWGARGMRDGVLVVSPPGGGKTTLLKDFIASISEGERAKRVAVIDTKGELSALPKAGLVDILYGYPRKRGLLVALTTLAPEVMVCDELCRDDVDSVLAVARGGIPLIASLHGYTREGVLSLPWLSPLLSLGVFSLLCFVRRDGKQFYTEVEVVP